MNKLALAMLAALWSTAASAQDNYLREIRDNTAAMHREMTELRTQVAALSADVAKLRLQRPALFIASALVRISGYPNYQAALNGACSELGYPNGVYTTKVEKYDDRHVTANVVCFGPR